LAFVLWLTGLPSDLEVKCSAAIRANVLVAELPKGPVGTSAEFSAHPSGTTIAVAFSVEGTCWGGWSAFFKRRGWRAIDRHQLAFAPKKGKVLRGEADG
jgi:hypothetical protein